MFFRVSAVRGNIRILTDLEICLQAFLCMALALWAHIESPDAKLLNASKAQC
jgi:hypothetical protein